MTGMSFDLRQTPPLGSRIDMRPIFAADLGTLPLPSIERLELIRDGQPQPLGDWFRVARSTTSTISFTGDLSCVDFIGAGNSNRNILVEGSVGNSLGWRMNSGTLIVRGNAGRYCAGNLRGGKVEVFGNTGDWAGGAASQDRLGQRGGKLIIHGTTGKWAGHRMRRGLMIVHGEVDCGLGLRMIAGTIVCCSRIEPAVGAGMRRGSILVMMGEQCRCENFAPAFSEGEESELSVLPILLKDFRDDLPESVKSNLTIVPQDLPRRGWRSVGDRTIGGWAEIIGLSLL